MHRIKPKPPAFKHGGYSAIDVLPTESRAEFEKLHRDLVSQYLPSGPLEEHVVRDLTRLIWRRDHLGIFQTAKIARKPFVSKEKGFQAYSSKMRDLEELEAEECAALIKSHESEARNELGATYDLLAAGEIATVPFLLEELRLMERLDEMIDKCIKRLLRAKGLSSISISTPAPVQHLPAPAKVA